MNATKLLGYLALVAFASAAAEVTTAATSSTENHLLPLHTGDDVEADLGRQPMRNFTDFMQIRDVLNVFSVEHIGTLWPEFAGQLNGNCSKDLLEYMQALEAGDMWAMQMDDASGRYTNGFFYGNNYFMGSQSLCKTIFKDETDIILAHKQQPKKTGLSFSQTYTVQNQRAVFSHDNPPFYPGFFVLRVLVNESSVLLLPRTVYIGMCLPTTCRPADVLLMAQHSQRQSVRFNVEVQAVRSPTQSPYDYWADSTFLLLVLTTAIACTLITWGTLLELYLTSRLRRQQRRRDKCTKVLVGNGGTDSSSEMIIGCTTYDLTSAAPPNKSDLPIGIVIPSHRGAGGLNGGGGGGGVGGGGMNNNDSDENLASCSADTGASTDGSAAPSDGSTVAVVVPSDERFGLCTELLLSFSVITNFRAICDRSVGSDSISCIHGLRAISMAWVILGHTCIITFKYSDNMELRKVVEKQFLFQTVTNGAYSVDTFFFMSGFLVSYIYFRTNAKGKLEKLSQGVSEITAGTYHFFGLVMYRFIRLTVPYVFVLGVVEVSMKYFEHNSIFDPPTQDHINCPKYWWRNVLYINTLFPVEDMCMLWSWYLADDTQFYIIGAIILIIAVRHFRIASAILGVFMLSSWATTGYFAFAYNHQPNSDDPLALFDKIYDKPWTRLGPYLIGMCVGWVLFKTNCKLRLRRSQVIGGWVLASATLLYLIYGLYNVELTRVQAAAFSSLSHSAWALALAWIVVACSCGYGGYVNQLLSAPVIYPFSRVTYCAYLVHPIVIRLVALNSDAPLHLSFDSMAITFLGQMVASFVLAFAVSLAFEAPVVTMLKILTPNRKKRLV